MDGVAWAGIIDRKLGGKGEIVLTITVGTQDYIQFTIVLCCSH